MSVEELMRIVKKSGDILPVTDNRRLKEEHMVNNDQGEKRYDSPACGACGACGAC